MADLSAIATAPPPGSGPPPVQHWAVDKRIPLALIFALVLQTVGLVIWAVRLDARVAALEADRLSAAVGASAARTTLTDQGQRIVRLETQYQSIATQLTAIDTKLDRLMSQRFGSLQ